MNLTHLRYFSAVVREGGLRAASRNVHVTQPALSHAIQKLESELGVQLFDRSGRSVVPTPDGMDVYRLAQQVLAQVEHMTTEVAALRGLETTQVRLAAPPMITNSVLLGRLTRFFQENSGIRIRLVEMSGALIEDAVLRGEIDIGVVGRAPKLEELALEPVIEAEICAFVGKFHSLAKQKHITWSQILDHPIASLPKPYRLHDYLMQIAASHSRTANMVLETDTLTLLISILRQNQLVGLLLDSKDTVYEGLRKLQILPETEEVERYDTTVKVGLCYRRRPPMSEAVRRVMSALIK